SKTVAVMGIHRTGNASEAITDMAVMNMGLTEEQAQKLGLEASVGYSFKDYEELVKEKKIEIDEFINSFLPAIREYRENYKNGKGEAHQRAVLAHDMLNLYYDGEVDGRFARHDSGQKLGDLLLGDLMQEKNMSDSDYEAMNANDRVKYGDLQQIILEGSVFTVTSMEQLIGLSTDTDEGGWLARLSDLSGVDLANHIEYVLPEKAGQNLSRSAAQNELDLRFGDYAKKLSSGYYAVSSDLMFVQTYLEENELLQGDNEKDEDYYFRVMEHFGTVIEEADAEGEELTTATREGAEAYTLFPVYVETKQTDYEGEWGDTLYDFFLPEDGENYSSYSNFIPFAASLSDGQRASISFLTLTDLIKFGCDAEGAVSAVREKIADQVNTQQEVDVYTGVNRAIFRDGMVALTNRAMMEAAQRNPFDDHTESTDFFSWNNSISLTCMIGGTILMVAGIVAAKLSKVTVEVVTKTDKVWVIDPVKMATSQSESPWVEVTIKETATRTAYSGGLYAGCVVAAIGAALAIYGAVTTGIELSKKRKVYQERNFTMIPYYIVDEADIVSYTTDANGVEKKNIEFDQYVYYEAVKCNRQDYSRVEDPQNGVNHYNEWGCGDLADLNCDTGKQWLALYTVKSPKKGDPILADSLKLQTGSNKLPINCNGGLHLFTYDSYVDIADEAYCYEPGKKLYFFWKSSGASETSSVFSTGIAALAGVAGLVVGALGTATIMMSKKKKETDTTATTA
ncbi:MAG: hypothetical protein J5851_03780, partial [Oscillospiraceae bacterium]|nr:hypothetical protein [Oscillospiraceae bacterium]